MDKEGGPLWRPGFADHVGNGPKESLRQMVNLKIVYDLFFVLICALQLLVFKGFSAKRFRRRNNEKV